jgi:hypothetical protein
MTNAEVRGPRGQTHHRSLSDWDWDNISRPTTELGSVAPELKGMSFFHISLSFFKLILCILQTKLRQTRRTALHRGLQSKAITTNQTAETMNGEAKGSREQGGTGWGQYALHPLYVCLFFCLSFTELNFVSVLLPPHPP